MSVDNTETINILSLCTGYGGLELGLARALAGVFRVVAVEVEAYALANLAAKVQEGKLAIEAMWPDLKTFPAQRFRGCFDFVLAGYPCQPFSVAGKRKGTDDPRHLWPHIARIVQAVRPVWCFFENVPGHLTIGYPEVYRSLRLMGYSIEAGLFTAAECGASMAGERLFVLAKANGVWKLQSQGCKQDEWGRLNNSSAQAVATSKSKGCANSRQSRAETARPRLASSSSYVRGVAFQEEEQYDWEEPRAVATTNNRRNRRSRAKAEQDSNKSKNRISKQNGKHKNGEAKSQLDRAINGTDCRMDRIRLIGNGVVPQQAEKAFRYLIERFE